MITAIVLTHNSEKTIQQCLNSLKWTDKIVVIDSGSSDQTVLICTESGASVYSHPYKNYGDQLNYALTLVNSDWVLVVDSDECVTQKLADSVKNAAVMPDQSIYSGYKISRKSYFLNKPVLHGGWYPDFVLRLFLKQKGTYKERELGSSPVVQGSIGKLKGDLIHHPYDTLNDYFVKFHRYADAWAREMHKKDKKCRLIHLLLWPPARFLKMFVLKAGFLDGIYGFILSVLTAFYIFTKYLKLYDYQLHKPSNSKKSNS
ncbi:MAG: hypothetical protein A2161_03230 [Candidatus Schekmanbacteria bacterium RBG_13_48_7]|uniref:Glycosyltransferase 2-like domain-containing protein n=1 Tax=Candidatus Schekmanbacteria bacterium RBG_13_48_7 TaxID=1817878 RepID=A0A1F7RTL8_9BACT|nr:MAG: hypothetical protein A2161_03230 [Candidatus Schekmanbacteria bacterium RBG_13_48_7]